MSPVNRTQKTMPAIFAVAIAACGGGGGGERTAVTPPPPPPSPPAAAAPLVFSEVASASGISFPHEIVEPNIDDAEIFSAGVAAGDYDNDGDIDLYVVGGNGATPNLLYRNDGGSGLSFTEVAAAAGVDLQNIKGAGSTFADFDGDGFLDLLVGAVANDATHAFINNGDGTFDDITSAAGFDALTRTNTVSAAFADYDLDGDLDLALSHWEREAVPPVPITDTQTLWRNNGDSSFSNVSVASQLATAIGGDGRDYTFTPNFADIDDDGYPDLLIAADFTTSQYFLNNRDGTFSEATDSVITDDNGMGASLGDYDSDGDLDWFVTSIMTPSGSMGSFTGNRLYRNEGDGRFSDQTDAAGVRDGGWGWGSCFADFNNDGVLDIFHVNGWVDSRFTDDLARLFVADFQGGFSEVAVDSGINSDGQGRGIVCADFDRDGDIDIFITNNQQFAELYRNDSPNSNNYLNVVLRGSNANSAGIGARVYVTDDIRTQSREVSSGSNYVSQNPAEAHFGIGATTVVSEVRVVWLGGTETVLNNVAVNQQLTVVQ